MTNLPRLWLCLLALLAGSTPPVLALQELVVWGSWKDRGLKAALRQFETEHPGWTVVTSTGASSGMDPQKLMCGIAGGSPPDMLVQDRFAVGEWAVRDAFIPLDAHIAQSQQNEARAQRAVRALRRGDRTAAAAALQQLQKGLKSLGPSRQLDRSRRAPLGLRLQQPLPVADDHRRPVVELLPGSYAFARLNWPGRDLLFGVLLATMMLPPQVTMIPVFMLFRLLGWYNSLKALWAPSFLGSAFFIFMLRQFMKAIPTDLEEAAKIDGCNLFGIYWRIILPLMKPALAAVCIFTFMGTWNDFMGPLIYLNDQRLYPLALGLFDFRSQYNSEFGMLMAASTLMSLPVIAIFFLAQKYFIQGVTLTGMKG